MSGKLDYINMIKKVSPYNLKKGILYLQEGQQDQSSGCSGK